jgi:mannose-6-phosphate isomerase-like protein (cupin superfamily)
LRTLWRQYYDIYCRSVGNPGRAKWRRRTQPDEETLMYVLDNARRPAASLPGLTHHTLAGSDQGLAHLSLWRQTIAPGGATPPHCHDCEEVVIVESGSGELRIDGASHAFGPDSTLVIPRNADHQIVNTGSEPLRLTAAFSTSPVEVFLPDGQAFPLPWAS